MTPTGDQALLKRLNRSALLRLLRAQPGLSRARLAQASGLTKSTVSALVRELIDDRWLQEAPAAMAEGRGRPSTPLTIDERARALIGLEIGVDTARVACVSLGGALLDSRAMPLNEGTPGAVCQIAATLAAHAWRHMQAQSLMLSGIGVGVPGAVDDDTGIVLFAPNLGWRNVDLLPELIGALALAGLPPVPVQLQNESDVAALGEYEFATGRSDDPLVFVTCDVGVGAGIVLNDRLFTGGRGMAGEIGHTILEPDGPACSCGRRGCAEAFFGARQLGRGAAAGHDLAGPGRMLGVLLQNLWTTFDPRAIVVGGASCVRYPGLLEAAIGTVEQYAQAAGIAPPMIRPARHGLLAAAVGAAALSQHDDLRPMQPNTVARRERAVSLATAQ